MAILFTSSCLAICTTASLMFHARQLVFQTTYFCAPVGRNPAAGQSIADSYWPAPEPRPKLLTQSNSRITQTYSRGECLLQGSQERYETSHSLFIITSEHGEPMTPRL